LTPTDPLYGQQWHFSLMGNIQAIWNDYDGSGVTVVVYDEGVEYTHPDLAANFDTTFFTYNGVIYDPMPLTPDSGHGTSCAGLIGAVSNNGIGGTGVASGVTLSAVNYLDVIQYEAQDVYDAAMLWAANYDIMSNSWGWSGGYSRAQNLADATSQSSHDIDLWETVVGTGRDGLGTIIVKAAGNDTLNSNGDGWNVSRYTLTISATDNLGKATYYTNYGSDILVAGPASAVTTDMTGDAGYNDGIDTDPVPVDYTSTFNGTSAATPTVAGVVALMLDANENLGWRDVENILALSAHHTGSALGAATGTTYEIGTWATMGGKLWNGGGTEYHQSYGYGMVDAFAAVRFAEAWAVIYPGLALTSANEQSATINYTGAALAISDATGQTTMNLVSNSNITVESIMITLDVTHANARDLELYLKTPDGKMIAIYQHDGNGRLMDNGLTWAFTVDNLRGYSAAGTWSIVAKDTVTGSIGTLDDASITFYGSASTATNDVYNFTQDFQLMAGYEASRKVIDDTNGGTDWLNFASMETALNISMAAGGKIKFGTTTVASLGTGVSDFEKLYAGDGNDTVNGNELNNEIWGARGNDSLLGNSGNDSINGGVGADKLFGNAGLDTIVGGDGNDSITGAAGNDLLFGNAGSDTFIYTTGAGSDSISGWEDNLDTLQIDDAIYGAGKTVAQLVSTYAHVVGANTVFDFGSVKFTVLSVTDLNIFLDDIVIV
jgi:subtilisin-like proprotein convertase family protein